jgi:hypothetical protein
MKTIITLISGALLAGLLVSLSYAAPVTLDEAQLDGVAAGGVDRVEGFVCPVISTDAVLNSPKGGAIGEGHYTIGGPDVMIPVTATNGDGTGTPPGPHSQPGDTDYTAVWAIQ